jgi:hypothetical protein
MENLPNPEFLGLPWGCYPTEPAMRLARLRERSDPRNSCLIAARIDHAQVVRMDARSGTAPRGEGHDPWFRSETAITRSRSLAMRRAPPGSQADERRRDRQSERANGKLPPDSRRWDAALQCG